jgi:diacylglycerol kinase (ATP)
MRFFASQPASGTVVLIENPDAGRTSTAPSPTGVLRSAGVAVGARFLVQELDAVRPLGRRWQRQGYAAAVVAGGDGTVAAVATQLAESSLPLGILPLGTSNDTARSLGVPLDLAQAGAVIAQGVATAIDLGQVVPAQVQRTASRPTRIWHQLHRLLPPTVLPRQRVAALGGSYFLHALTLGLNVEFARLATDTAHRRRWRALTYPAAFIEALAHFRPVHATLELAGCVPAGALAPPPGTENIQMISCLAAQVAVVNTPVIGGGAHVRLAGVDPQDRLLDVIVIEAPQVPRLREILDGFRTGQATGHGTPEPSQAAQADGGPDREDVSLHDMTAGRVLPGVYHYQGRTLRLATAEPVDLATDGEVAGHTPAEISLAPAPLRVFLPI